MPITLEELQDMITEALENGADPQAQIHVAQQPSYPLSGDCLGLLVVDAHNVSVVSGTADGYASKDLWNELGAGF